MLIHVVEERFESIEAERGAELRIVAELRMNIEREVRAINGEVVFHKQVEQLAAFASPRMRWVPEKSVMDDE